MTAKMLDEFVKLILCYKLKWIHSDSSCDFDGPINQPLDA